MFDKAEWGGWMLPQGVFSNVLILSRCSRRFGFCENIAIVLLNNYYTPTVIYKYVKICNLYNQIYLKGEGKAYFETVDNLIKYH